MKIQEHIDMLGALKEHEKEKIKYVIQNMSFYLRLLNKKKRHLLFTSCGTHYQKATNSK